MSEQVEFADERKAVIVDEFAEVDVADPTFGGMREPARLEDAYLRAVAALTELYRTRYQHSVPENAAEIFRELSEELNLPYEEEIRMLIDRKKNEQRYTPEETQKLIAVVNKFIKQMASFKE